MWAWRYIDRVALDALRVVEVPDPAPGPRDIVVQMRAAALNFRDLAIASGHYHVGVSPPLTPLSDGAGEVVAVGAEVTRFRVGDLVCPVYMPDWRDGPVRPEVAKRRLGGPSDGVLSEFMVVDEEDAVLAPRHLAPEEAATLPVAGVTAYHTLFELGDIKPGEVLVVQGAGGVSAAAVQIGAACGTQVISLVRDDRHVATLRGLGASDILTVGASEAWPAEVTRRTRGGADAVLTVAGGETVSRAVAATRVGGRVLVVGYAGSTAAPLDIFDAIRHATTLRVATAGHRRSFEGLVRLMEARALRPAVAHIYPVSAIGEALTALAAGGHCGKIVLRL